MRTRMVLRWMGLGVSCAFGIACGGSVPSFTSRDGGDQDSAPDAASSSSSGSSSSSDSGALDGGGDVCGRGTPAHQWKLSGGLDAASDSTASEAKLGIE